MKFAKPFLWALFLPISCFAADESTYMRDSFHVISNLKHALKVVKARTKDPIFFPNKVPKKNNSPQFYADTDFSRMPAGIFYRINVDATKDCHGVSVCNLGFVLGNKKGKIVQLTDKHNKNITHAVKLAHRMRGFYTPEQVDANLIPATIQWKDHHIAYTIAWDTNNRKRMITLANAAILAGPR